MLTARRYVRPRRGFWRLTAISWLRKCAMLDRLKRRCRTVAECCPACVWDMQTFRLSMAKVGLINDALG